VVATHPILLIVLHRPEYDLRWSHVSHHTPIVLKSLERGESERIVRFTLGAAYLPDALGSTIHDRTGGNPFFVEEFARALAESGEVTVRDGEPWLTRGLDSLRLPRTVEAIIRSRVDRLAPGAREALRLAAVIGHDFDRRILEALHSQRESLPQAISVLRDQELIFQTRELPEPAYRFNHALTQVAVYESLLLPQRSELHGRVGQAIESLCAGRLEEYYEALARHYGQSGNTEKAIDYLEKAGDKAARLFSLGQSRAYYREAIERIDSLESTAARKIRRIDLTIKWATASYYAPAPEAVPVLEVSRNYASLLEDELRFWKLTYSMARVEYVRGSLIQALPLVNRCLELANALGEPSAVALSHSLYGRICCFTGEYETGRRHLETSLPLLRELGNQDEESYSLGFLALIHARLGDFDKGVACGAECRRLAEASNNKTRLAASGIYNGIVEYLRGEWAAAHDEFSRSWTLSREIGDLFIAGIARAFQGCARSMMGERKGAVDALMEGCGLIEKQGLLLSVNNVYAWCADAFVRLGHPDLARAYAKKALIRERFGERYGMAWAHRVLAIVGAGNTPSHWEDAEAHTRESLRWASALSQRPDEAVTRFRHAEILHKKGDRKRAMEQLAEAARLFRDMKMTWWMKQVEALGGRIERGEPFCWFTPVPDRPPAPSMRD
jgi:tetratricopeptide (TPR) repeat protein